MRPPWLKCVRCKMASRHNFPPWVSADLGRFYCIDLFLGSDGVVLGAMGRFRDAFSSLARIFRLLTSWLLVAGCWSTKNMLQTNSTRNDKPMASNSRICSIFFSLTPILRQPSRKNTLIVVFERRKYFTEGNQGGHRTKANQIFERDRTITEPDQYHPG